MARTGASLIEALPGAGTLLGGVSMSDLSGSFPCAICQAALRHFRSEGTFFDLEVDRVRDIDREAHAKGRDFVKSFQSSDAAKAAQEASESIAELAKLKTCGLLTEEEYEAKKALTLAKLGSAVEKAREPHAGE